MFSLPLTRLFDAIKNSSDLQPNCHTRFQVAVFSLLLWLSFILLVLALLFKDTFLLGLNAHVHADQEALVIGVNIE
jgi:hypothetical protein